MKRPAFQFYPADWRKDPALSTCSLAARGLWIEMMCIAHESEQYGYLCIAGKPMTAQQIARGVGESPAIVTKLMDELESCGVFSRDENGVIFSRRMVKDEHVRNVRADAGRLGGNPNLLGNKVKQKVKQTDNQIQTPSSSSSSSSSEDLTARNSETVSQGDPPPRAPLNGKKPTPEGEMAVSLRDLGVTVTSQNPLLLGWIRDGITTQQATDATALARMRKPHPEPIPPAYLDRILREPQRTPAPVKPAIRYRTADEIERDEVITAIRNGKADAEISRQTMIPIERVQSMREELSHAEH